MLRSGLVIWLHGLGDTGGGWSFLERQLGLSPIRYLFPDAPVQAVTCNGGYRMTSWMDLDTIPIGLSLPDDEPGLAASARMVHELIDAEVAKGTPSTDIILGGFSQGGAMALHAGYSYPKPLDGVACLSGWAALRDGFETKVRGGANKLTPCFVGHGTMDGVVLPECGAKAAEMLKELGVDVTYGQYPVEHGAHPQELDALKDWVEERMAA